MAKVNAIGIDFGTTSSCMAVFRNGHVDIIADDQGGRTTPSYVAFKENKRLVGDAAKNQADINPENTVFASKRMIGRKFHDPIMQWDMRHWPFKIVNGGGKPKVQIKYERKTKIFALEEISSMILVEMKETAETFLGSAVDNVVVTVPATYNYWQRETIKDACSIAGLNVLRVVGDSTAAAMAYAFGKKWPAQHNVLIFDLGSGTCSVSIVTCESGVYEVRAVASDLHLGGEDFDNRVVNHFLDEFRHKHRKELTTNPRAIMRLRTACERAKCLLSSSTQTRIEVDALFKGIDFNVNFTRELFEDLCADLFRCTLEPVEKCLHDARLDKSMIHEIVLVGGSARIPQVQKLLSDFFGGKELNKTVNFDEAVAFGAAVQAALLSGDRSEILQDILLNDVAPISLGIETLGGVMTPLIKRNSTIPIRTSQTFSINSDSDRLGRCRLDATNTKEYTSVVIKVFEGEREIAKDNNLLCKFELLLTAPASQEGEISMSYFFVARSHLQYVENQEYSIELLNDTKLGEQKRRLTRNLDHISKEREIEVTFDVDANRILNVFAEEKSSPKQYKAIATSDLGLSKDEIKRMVQEAKIYKDRYCTDAADESSEHDRVSAKNALESYAYNMKQTADDAKLKCERVLKWLNENPAADKEQFEQIRKKLEVICDTTIAKLISFT